MPADRHAQQAALLAWYRQHHRRLPWRADPDGPPAPAYAVLVSELMLQQTRVDTVLGYFARWLARFPTLADLAAAPEADVLGHWTGLGYYNRARNLHATARAVVERHGGALPTDGDALAALPGLGPYTVGAVRSIAFGQPAPLVDGNVARVLARWLALEAEPSAGPGKAAVWRAAAAWLQDGPAHAEPGTWNQALMELGATICTPRKPRCERCPVRAGCRAATAGRQETIPPPKLRQPPKPVTACYALVVDPQGRVLLGRRPATGRWAGLWEPPGTEGRHARPELERWLAGEGLHAAERLGVVVHVLTHRRYEAEALRVPAPAGRPTSLAGLDYAALRWVAPDEALGPTSGLSRLAVRLVELLEPPGIAPDPAPVAATERARAS